MSTSKTLRARSRGARGDTARLRVTLTALGILAFAASLLALGLPATLALSGGVLLSAAVGGLVPGLRGPAAWAAGVILEVGLVLGASAAIAFVTPHPQPRLVHLAILLLPNAAGLVGLAVCARRFVAGGARVSGQHLPHLLARGVPGIIVGSALLVMLAVSATGEHHNIAWAMSGDARNHVSVMRGLLADGGLTVEALRSYPAAVNAFAAEVAGASDRSGTARDLILTDVRALASTYVLGAIATATLLAGALLELLPRGERLHRRSVAAIAVTVLVGGAAAASPLALGFALADGFLSAYCSLPLALAGVVLALRYYREPSDGAAAMLFLIAAVPLTFMGWTLLAVVPLALLGAVTATASWRLVRGRRSGERRVGRSSRVLWWILVGAAVLLSLAIGALVYSYRARLVAQFVLPGTSRSVHPFLLVVAALVALSTLVIAGRSAVRRQMVVPLVVALAGGLTLIWLTRLPGPGVTWTYYAHKTNWLVSVVLVWVLIAPVVLWLSARDVERTPTAHPEREGPWRTSAAAGLVSAAVVLLAGSATSAPEPLLGAARGWSQPSAEVVVVALDAADDDEPYVLWEWADPGNDRLANFWSVLAWGAASDGEYSNLPGLEGGIYLWAYFQTSEITSLCAIAEASPGLDIYTRTDPAELLAQLDAACPDVRSEIKTDSSQG